MNSFGGGDGLEIFPEVALVYLNAAAAVSIPSRRMRSWSPSHSFFPVTQRLRG